MDTNNTLDRIMSDAANAMAKARRGEPLTNDETLALKLAASIKGGKAFNAGKRKPKRTGK